MTLTLTWAGVFGWETGLILLVLSIIAIFAGPLPDHGGSAGGELLRKIAWPLFAVWIVGVVFRGLFVA